MLTKDLSKFLSHSILENGGSGRRAKWFKPRIAGIKVLSRISIPLGTKIMHRLLRTFETKVAKSQAGLLLISSMYLGEISNFGPDCEKSSTRKGWPLNCR